MNATPRFTHAIVAGVLLMAAASAPAAMTFPFVVDFSTEDDEVTPLVNGQAIDDEFGVVFTIESDADVKDHLGPAIFDTDPAGPNAGGGDADLLVDLGNALILQNDQFPTQTVPGIFDTPDDEQNASDLGAITFDFIGTVELLAIDLIDINGGVTVELTLTDLNGNERVYSVEERWTYDISAGSTPATADGFSTLSLTETAPQEGERPGRFATAVTDPLFDSTKTVSLTIEFNGSAAIDNLVIGGFDPQGEIPEPAAIVLTTAALLTLGVARRRDS